MSIQLTVPSKRELKPRIVVFGVGGAGGNAVNNMIAAGLDGVDFVVANTDAQALSLSKADRRIQMGAKLTEGLGAGSDPEVGAGAAEEALADIIDILQGAHMAFITAGMGGGTGTGAAPVIARASRESGILTVGVVTKPFEFEGTRRMRFAEAGIEALAKEVDTLIIIPNQNLFRIANAQTTFGEAFALADEVLHSGVAGITDLMLRPGLINLDFADVRAVMNEMGKAMMGTGEADGDNRAIEAAEAAISNPLLEDVSMQGARGILINITGGNDMTLYDVEAAANRVAQEVDPDANIIIGSTFDEALGGRIRVSVVATGIDAIALAQPEETGTVVSISRETPAAHVVHEVAQPADHDEEPAPAAEPSSLPAFMTERPIMPARREIPERSRSFIERVFGSRKKVERDRIPQAEEQVAHSLPSSPEQEQTQAPMSGPVEPEQVVAQAQAVDPIPVQNVPDIEDVPAVAEKKVPSLPLDDSDDMMVPNKPSRSYGAAKIASSAVKPAPSRISTAQEKPEMVRERAVNQVSAVATAQPPVIQTTMQTPTTMASGFDGDQLDIPTFLRR